MSCSSKILVVLALSISGALEPLAAQTLRLRQQGTGANRVTAQVGETVTIEVFGELPGVEAAGFSLFISLPDDAFMVVDQRPRGEPGAQAGVQPFVQGPLFTGAGEQANYLISENDPAANSFEGQQLEYAAVVGGAGDRIRTGSGVLAFFQVVCLVPIDNGLISIDDNPIRETRLVLSDGISEKRFVTTQNMELTVTGLELRLIPDVILAQGQIDSTQLGRLSDYVELTRPSVSADSIEWSFSPADLDSIQIEVNPETKRVTITPMEGWSGRQQIVWTATEPASSVRQGEPVLSVNAISEIVVNNPPMFLIERDPDGVRRDTVRFDEDEHGFRANISASNPKAFNYGDLDAIVQDPDIDDPQDELRFLPQGAGSPNLKSMVVGETHELLLWSLENYNGTDSLRVIVADGFYGGVDTLLVYVEVNPVPDPPEFTLDEDERRPKMSRGGTKTYLLHEIVFDIDTPVDSLALAWIDDPGGNFTVDTTRIGNDLEVAIKGRADFAGDGRITFTATDTDSLADTMALFFTAAEALPPSLIQDEIKIELSPGGVPHLIQLDDFVSDPDNAPSELIWTVPPSTSQIGIDEDRRMSVAAPLEFIGYEEVFITVYDPSGQGDELQLRIYSSEGFPVAGGLPDLIMDRGEINQEFDLDDYYYDANNNDGEMFWEKINTYNQNNLEVNIDPITHVTTIFVLDDASFGTEEVVFRVTSPEGTSANDTMLVTVRSGGGGGSSNNFRLREFPEVSLPVGVMVEMFNLNDFVQPIGDFPVESLQWKAEVMSGFAGSSGNILIPTIREDNAVVMFGFEVGIDTVVFTAQDTLGQTQTKVVPVNIFEESEALYLLSIPDIQFIAQQNFDGLLLSDFIEDPVIHPDSVVSWTYEPLGDQGSLFVRVNPDNTVFATASDTLEAQGVFVAKNNELGVVGRDTVRVIALDPGLAIQQLHELPPVVFLSGFTDSSITLNDFLPTELFDSPSSRVRWSVSGQQITQPVIGTQAPHQLRISSIGERVGVDTLNFLADIGGGFSAMGAMYVTVLEPVDDLTLDIQVVPNPLDANFLDLFVIARRELAGTPNVLQLFETTETPVALRQLEEDLEGKGVLMWTGRTTLPVGTSGLVRFETQAFTAKGTDVRDTTSVTIASAVAGKRAVLAHGGARLELEPDALVAGTTVLLQVGSDRAMRPADELELVTTIDAFPAGIELKRPGHLAWEGPRRAGEGIYHHAGGVWEYQANTDKTIELTALGRYGILRDQVPPQLKITAMPGPDAAEMVGEITDAGSGVHALKIWIAGDEAPLDYDGETFRWQVPTQLVGAEYVIELRAWDRAGNQRVERISIGGFALPRDVQLEANYPNPFNPETTIPLLVPQHAGRVRLVIYNTAGQMVRVLVDQPIGAGRHHVLWDGRDERGRQVGSGVYVYQLLNAGTALTRSMTLLK